MATAAQDEAPAAGAHAGRQFPGRRPQSLLQTARLHLLLLLPAVLGCPPSSTCKVSEDCARGKSCCSGACVDLASTPDHCGTCGTVCAVPNAKTWCQSGLCQLQCSAGFGNCNGDSQDGCETSISDSVATCGSCTRSCGPVDHATPICAASLCRIGACVAPFGDCDLDGANGCEVDTSTTLAACGACGRPCTIAHGTGTCVAGTCQVLSCDGTHGDCDGDPSNGCEADLTGDLAHCGRCAHRCGPQQLCEGAQCRASQLIVFGGVPSFTAPTPTAQVFRFELTTGTFSLLAPAAPSGAPSARSRHVAAFDLPRNRMLVWGGVDGFGSVTPADLWALDFSTEPPAWSPVATTGLAPSPRLAPAAAVDPLEWKLYLFGGMTELGAGLSDLYALDFATDTWTKLHDGNAPAAPGDRVYAAAAFDPGRRRVLIFGGTDASHTDLSELWSFDVSSGTWAAIAGAGRPYPRALSAFFDGSPAHLFGGVAGLTSVPAPAADFYALDVAAAAPWTVIAQADVSARFFSGRAAARGKLYLFGGASVVSGSTPTAVAELWAFDLGTATWTRLSDGSGPFPTGKIAASLVAR